MLFRRGRSRRRGGGELKTEWIYEGWNFKPNRPVVAALGLSHVVVHYFLFPHLLGLGVSLSRRLIERLRRGGGLPFLRLFEFLMN